MDLALYFRLNEILRKFRKLAHITHEYVHEAKWGIRVGRNFRSLFAYEAISVPINDKLLTPSWAFVNCRTKFLHYEFTDML